LKFLELIGKEYKGTTQFVHLILNTIFTLLKVAQVMNLFILFFSCRLSDTQPQTYKVKFYSLHLCTTTTIMAKCTAHHLYIA